MEIAVADRPLLGIRTRMMVSVLVAASAPPACSWASSSAESGLPWASVRLSMPTNMMSRAPSSRLPPSMAAVKWKIPLSNERTEPHATPVPTVTSTASSAATVRPSGRPRVTAVTSVSAGTCPGYWR